MNASQAKSLVSKGVEGRHAIGNGLYLRVTKPGLGYWVVRYTINGMRREIAIGRYADLSLARAKHKASEIKLDISEGLDPLIEKEREKTGQIVIVNDLADDWFKECDVRLKNPQIPRQVYRDYIQPSLGKHAVKNVSALDIRSTIKKPLAKGVPTRSNDTLMYCKQLFGHAVKLGVIDSNPAAAFRNFDAGGQEQSRNRALTTEEIKEVLDVMRKYSDQFTRENYLAVLLLLTLGVRKSELIQAKWSEFDFSKGVWELPKERSKTGASIRIPLCDQLINWLDELKVRANSSEYLFPNRRASKRFGHISPDTLNAAIAKLFSEEKLKVEHFTVHDLRRTFRSLLASLQVPPHIAERCLNHKLKGVEGVYDRYDYFDERREGLDRVSKLVSKL